MPQLTGVLAEFEEIAGFAAAIKIAAVKGGTVAYIPQPRNLKPEHWLCAAIGSEDAIKIAKQFGGNEIEIPLGPFGGNRGRVWRIIRQAIKDGHSAAKAARLAGVTMRTVRRHKSGETAGNKENDGQGVLF